MSRLWPLFAKATPDLKARRAKALEAAAWGVGRGVATGAAPGFVLQMPAYVVNDLWMFKAIYECYFDASPTELELKELMTKYLTATGMAAMSVSAARALASYIAALPSPVTTPLGASIAGGAAFGTAARIMVVCEALYKQRAFSAAS
jgi:hypothetical protein